MLLAQIQTTILTMLKNPLFINNNAHTGESSAINVFAVDFIEPVSMDDVLRECTTRSDSYKLETVLEEKDKEALHEYMAAGSVPDDARNRVVAYRAVFRSGREMYISRTARMYATRINPILVGP